MNKHIPAEEVISRTKRPVAQERKVTFHQSVDGPERISPRKKVSRKPASSKTSQSPQSVSTISVQASSVAHDAPSQTDDPSLDFCSSCSLPLEGSERVCQQYFTPENQCLSKVCVRCWIPAFHSRNRVPGCNRCAASINNDHLDFSFHEGQVAASFRIPNIPSETYQKVKSVLSSSFLFDRQLLQQRTSQIYNGLVELLSESKYFRRTFIRSQL